MRQAEGWRQHSASVAEVAQGTIRDTEEELTAERLNAEELRLELQEAQDQLTTWQESYDQYDWEKKKSRTSMEMERHKRKEKLQKKQLLNSKNAQGQFQLLRLDHQQHLRC